MNEVFVKVFTELASFEDYEKRAFPAKAYRNAVQIFKELPFEVTSSEQLKNIPGIGDGIKKKVDAFLENGTFKRYEEYLASPVVKIKEIAEIKGIGINKAKSLYEAGCDLQYLKNLIKDGKIEVGDEIGNSGVKFTKAIKIGLSFEAHTNKNRMTVEEHDKVANPIIDKILNDKVVLECCAVGSRRRADGSPDYTIGDIDIIVNVQDENNTKEFRTFLESLLDEVIMSGTTKISGIKESRQIDIRIVPPENWGSLLMHSTGPMSFNVECRKIALKNGWTLNEYGLFDKTTSKCLASKNEKDIFEVLGIDFIEPSERKNFKS